MPMPVQALGWLFWYCLRVAAGLLSEMLVFAPSGVRSSYRMRFKVRK